MDYDIHIKINGSKINPPDHVIFRQKPGLGLSYLAIKQQTQSIKWSHVKFKEIHSQAKLTFHLSFYFLLTFNLCLPGLVTDNPT